MNWTEGSLARHSKSFNDDVARQKRHFARARAQRHVFGPWPSPSTAAPAPGAPSFVPDYLSGGDDAAAEPKLPERPALAPLAKGGAPASLQERKFRLLEKSDWAGIKAAAAPKKQWKNPLDPEGILLGPGPRPGSRAPPIREDLPPGFYWRREARPRPSQQQQRQQPLAAAEE